MHVTDPYRPQFHITPPSMWLNDPNGMIYSQGEYHIFYQYDPDYICGKDDNKHWGHCVSTDMMHWTTLAPALFPDEKGSIWSGSCVEDTNNTSGLFEKEIVGLVAFYTNFKSEVQTQCLAYSNDKGRTWTKYEGNPVLSVDDDLRGHKDFRDPKVFWHDESNQWLMIVAGGPVRLYSSDNLIAWRPEAMYTRTENGEKFTIITECPDLFKLPVKNTDTVKWVLSEGGNFYRVGDLRYVNQGDGKKAWTFVQENDSHMPMKFGPNAYAAQTYNHLPNGRIVLIQWMNGMTGKEGLTEWTGALTLQLELALTQTPDGFQITQTPIQEYESLRKSHQHIYSTLIPNGENPLSAFYGSVYEIIAHFMPSENTTEFGLQLLKSSDGHQKTIVRYQPKSGDLSVVTDSIYSQKVKMLDGRLKLHIFVDKSVVDVYTGDGLAVANTFVFPNQQSRGIEIYSVGGNTDVDLDFFDLEIK